MEQRTPLCSGCKLSEDPVNGTDKDCDRLQGNDPPGAHAQVIAHGCQTLTDLVHYIEQASLGPEPTPQPSASLFSISQTRVSMQRDAKL